MSSSQMSGFGLTKADKDKMTTDVAFFILAQERKRMPIRKADVFKATNLTGKPRDLQDEVFSTAQTKLHSTFGMRLKESREKKGTFYVLNSIENDLGDPHLEWSDEEKAQTAVLYIVLTAIYMSNGRMLKDSEVFGLLGQLGLWKDDHNVSRSSKNLNNTNTGDIENDVFELLGDVHNLIFREWSVRQHYLDIKKVETGNTDTEAFEIRWGERAEIEIKKDNLVEIASSLYGMEAEDFKEQYMAATKKNNSEEKQ